MRARFSAAERLKRQRDIDALFQSGKAHSFYPVRVIFRRVPRPAGDWVPVKTGVSAPKRSFKRAHDRARVKRLLREAWRLQKSPLMASVPAEEQWHVFLLYTGKELPEHEAVFNAVLKAIAWLEGLTGVRTA